MDKAIQHRRIHTIQYYSASEQDSYGDVEFKDPVDIQAYQYGKVKNITNMNGEEKVSSRVFIIDTIHDVNWGDELVYKGQRVKVQTYEHFDGLAEGTGTTVLYV